MDSSLIEKISNVGSDWAIIVAVVIQYYIYQKVDSIKQNINSALNDLRLTLARDYWTSAQTKEYIKDRESLGPDS